LPIFEIHVDEIIATKEEVNKTEIMHAADFIHSERDLHTYMGE